MPAARKAAAPVLAAATRESAVVGAVRADLRAVTRQLDALVSEVTRLQGLIDALQA